MLPVPPATIAALMLGVTVALDASLAPLESTQAQPEVPVRVSAEWLASRIRDRDVIVVAVHQQRAAYDSAHIPGARFLAYGSYAQRRNGLTTELPPLVTLDSLLESIGVSDRSRVVIYGPAVISHRLFLALEVAGFRGRVGVLEAGLEGWNAAGGPVTMDTPTVTAGSVTLRPELASLVDREWVRSHVDDPAYQFVDARMRTRFDESRIPGAVSVPIFSMLARGKSRDSWSLVPTDSLHAMLAVVDARKEAVTYCAIGETASVLYWVLRSLDRPVRLYDGSMEDWTADPSSPVERGPAAQRGANSSRSHRLP